MTIEQSIHRRINVATCWASTRIAVLDELEQYEDSYAITQEFREWLTCLGDHPDQLGVQQLPLRRVEAPIRPRRRLVRRKREGRPHDRHLRREGDRGRDRRRERGRALC